MQLHVLECIAVFDQRAQSVQLKAAPQEQVGVQQYAVEASTTGVDVEHRGDARGRGDAVPKQTGVHAHVACIVINARHL